MEERQQEPLDVLLRHRGPAAADAGSSLSHRISTSSSEDGDGETSKTSHSTTNSSNGAAHPHGRGAAERSAGAGAAAGKHRSSGRRPRDSQDDVEFVAAFLGALRKGVARGLDRNQEVVRRRKERKRQVNRASAKRKRVRAKLELEGLVQACKALEQGNLRLRAENARLTATLWEEAQRQSLLRVQLECLQQVRQGPPAVVPSPGGGAAPPNNILQSLVSSLNPNSEVGRLLQEYLEVERARQEILLRQQQQQRQPSGASPLPFADELCRQRQQQEEVQLPHPSFEATGVAHKGETP